MSKPLKEDYIIRIKSRIEQHVEEPVEADEKEEFVELIAGDVEFAKRLHEFFPCAGILFPGLERRQQSLMAHLELRAPLRELSEEFAVGDLLPAEGGREEVVCRIGIGAETFVEEAEMFLGDESEGVDLIAKFPGDGIDFVAEFLLFLRGQRREPADLLEVGSEGIGEVISLHIGKGICLRFRILVFVSGGLLHTSPQPGSSFPAADHSL